MTLIELRAGIKAMTAALDANFKLALAVDTEALTAVTAPFINELKWTLSSYERGLSFRRQNGEVNDEPKPRDKQHTPVTLERMERRNRQARIRRWIKAGWVKLTPMQSERLREGQLGVIVKAIGSMSYEAQYDGDDQWVRRVI